MVWWDPAPVGSEERDAWSDAELKELAEFGVCLPTFEERLQRRAAAWLVPLLSAQRRFTLVVHDGEQVQHPLWLRLQSLLTGCREVHLETSLLSGDGLHHLVLPSITLASLFLPLMVRLIYAEMREVLDSEYVKFAWSKGLHQWRIWLVHAFKNTLLPLITVGGVQLGVLVTYTILTETVFQWPGLGFLFLAAVNRVDTPLIITYLVVVGLIFVVINTLVDMVYGLVNPRITLTRQL